MTSPEETLARVGPFMPAMGITRIANITGLDRIGIPVVMVCRPNSRSVSVSQGKGLSPAAAKASGLMESLETYHAERVSFPLVTATYRELRSRRRVVDVRRLPRLRGGTFRLHRTLRWAEGYDLMAREPTWVPYEMVHTDLTLPLPPDSGCFRMSSNGLASGNHPLEAISHAICELIERDATTLWFRRDRRAQDRTRIDLATVDDANCRALLDRYERAGIRVAVWDTTTDIGIASFLCQIAEAPGAGARPVSGAHGMGCHFDRRIGLLRALTEAAQCRLTWISGSRDDGRAEDYDCSPDAIRRERDSMQEHGSLRSFRAVPTREADSFDADLRWALNRLKAVGIDEVVAVDLTRPEFRIPVVRVIIPGLEHVGFGEGLASYVPGPRGHSICRR